MKNSLPLSVIILTKNEESNILDCVETVKDVDEIIIIDDHSSDRTLEVVKSLKKKNIKVFKRRLEKNFSAQRNFALDKAKNTWVLYLDADERVPSGLITEFASGSGKFDKDGYFLKRTDVIWDKKLSFGETGDIWLLRLAKKTAGKWVGSVHESWDVGGETGRLGHSILHYPHPSVREFLSEVNFYSSIRALELKKANTKGSLVDIVMYPAGKFVKNYLLKRGFIDGLPGLVFALMMSFHSFLVRSKLWLLDRK